MDKKNFNDLTDAERKELENTLKTRAEKNGRSLLTEVKCVYNEEKKAE